MKTQILVLPLAIFLTGSPLQHLTKKCESIAVIPCPHQPVDPGDYNGDGFTDILVKTGSMNELGEWILELNNEGRGFEYNQNRYTKSDEVGNQHDEYTGSAREIFKGAVILHSFSASL